MTDRRLFSDFIAALYDCAIDPNLWSGALPMLVDYLDSRRAGVSSRNRKSIRPDFLIEFGFDPAVHEIYISKYAQMSPMRAACALFGVDEPVRIADMLDEDEFRQTRFYKEFYGPQDIGEPLTVKVIEDDNRTVHCTVYRAQAYEQEDIDKLREICPHIRRVMTISDLIDRKTVERDCFAEVIDALAVAVILVDANGRISHTNPAANEFLARGNILRSVGGVLSASRSNSHHELRVATATPDLAARSVPLESGSGHSVVATILPLTSGFRQDCGRDFPATAAVFVHDHHPADQGASAAVAALFGLTGAESRVLSAMLEGRTIAQTAEQFGISLNTARTHLQRLFSKTNTNRQSDLIRLAGKALPPVRQSHRNNPYELTKS
jgi:DNA-binding CsgD family transcriptional regulator/PAS domain-containing protein